MAKVAAQKITPFLWFDKEAEEAVNLYVSIFKNAKINGLSRYTEFRTRTGRVGDDHQFSLGWL